MGEASLTGPSLEPVARLDLARSYDPCIINCMVSDIQKAKVEIGILFNSCQLTSLLVEPNSRVSSMSQQVLTASPITLNPDQSFLSMLASSADEIMSTFDTMSTSKAFMPMITSGSICLAMCPDMAQITSYMSSLLD